MMVVIGTCQALSIFTASNSGAGQIRRIKEAYRISMLFTTLYLVVVIVLNFFLPKYLVGAFLDTVKNPDAYGFAKDYLQFSCFSYLLSGWKIINESLLRGFLKMKDYLYSNLSDLAGKVIMTYVFVAQFSLHGFWMGNMFGKIIAFGISTYLIIKGGILKDNSAAS